MLYLPRYLGITALLVHIATTLPSVTRCDTSYYEKYYSARRYTPAKKTVLKLYTFSVDLGTEVLQPFEQIAVVGDHKNLGSWSAQEAVLLNRSQQHNVWSAEVALPDNITLNYRYFVATVSQETGKRQVRRWESALEARTLLTMPNDLEKVDVFGVIAPGEAEAKREVTRGWLNSGRIVQFKLFRSPLEVDEPTLNTTQSLRIKLQAVDRKSLTPVLPSARIYVEYVRMAYGDSFLRAQPEFGVPYQNDDIVMFHATLGDVEDLQNLAFAVHLYAAEANAATVRLLGYQYVYPEVLQGSEGDFEVKLISPVWMNNIARLQMQYLVIKPLPGPPDTPVADFRTSFVDYWRPNWFNMDAGHRGLGKTFKPVLSTQPPSTENTLAAMKAAATLGADIVEFDVQLTSDLVPIIYHDFVIYVCLSSKTPTSRDDLTTVYIKDVTYEQLKNLKIYHVINNKVVEYAAHNNVLIEDNRLFPTFEDFLTKVDKSLGYDIEIKWPQMTILGTPESIQTIDKNTFVDRILDVMLRHGCGRFSFFSSFDVDILTLLRYKQNMYPVLLLQSEGPYYADPRTDGTFDTLNTAQAFDFAGIIPQGQRLQVQPDLVEVAKKINKKIFFWGDVLKDVESLSWFKSKNPTGLIYDRLDVWLPPGKQSIFASEEDLPEFFELQCTPKLATEGNVTFW